MVNEITQTSRGNSNNVIPSEARDLAQAGNSRIENCVIKAASVRFLAVWAARNGKAWSYATCAMRWRSSQTLQMLLMRVRT